MMLSRILITALVSYFLGNHNGAICVSAMLHDDVRSHGSGNAGLTNFIRSYGAGRSAMVIAIDVGKAVLACLLGALVFEPYGLRLEGMTLAGVCVMLGHDFPALQGFRGGKGIACTVGAAAVLYPVLLLPLVVLWGIPVLLTRYISLGSIIGGVALTPAVAAGCHGQGLAPAIPVGCAAAMTLLILWAHRENMARLARGEENKV